MKEFLEAAMRARDLEPEPAVLARRLVESGFQITYTAVYFWFNGGGIGRDAARALRLALALTSEESQQLAAIMSGLGEGEGNEGTASATSKVA